MPAFTIDANASCVDGHFPDRPVVPGVVIVDRAVRLITAVDGIQVTGLRRVKFPSELKPGTRCEVDWHYRNEAVRFECYAGTATIAVGTLDKAP